MKGKKISFIGTGVMGRSMAMHLLKAGAELTVYNRTKAKAQDLLDAGAKWADSAGQAARDASLIFTIVGYPKDVEEVYMGPDGIIAQSAPGAIMADFTTSEPELARRIAEEAARAGKFALDTPVSGGDLGAKNATLTIMVGGDEKAFESITPILAVMGKTIIRQGGPGAGQHTKMANQIVIAGNLIGAVEAISYAEAAGLDPRRVLDSIGGGSAQSWQLTSMVPRMLDGNFEPGFYSRHFLKDLGIALNSAKKMKIKLPLLEMAERCFDLLCKKDLADKGTQALYLMYRNGWL